MKHPFTFLAGVLTGQVVSFAAMVVALTVPLPAKSATLAVGGADTWGRGAPEHGPAVEVRWRGDGSLAPYAEIFGGRVTALSLGGAWHVQRGRFYFEPGAGVAVHLGDGRQDFGSPFVFHLTGALGYRLTDRLSVEVGAEHWSNAHLAKPDRGLNAVSARLAWRL